MYVVLRVSLERGGGAAAAERRIDFQPSVAAAREGGGGRPAILCPSVCVRVCSLYISVRAPPPRSGSWLLFRARGARGAKVRKWRKPSLFAKITKIEENTPQNQQYYMGPSHLLALGPETVDFH